MPFPDIVVKPDSSCFEADGPDILINSNIVSCKRPSYDKHPDSVGKYFSKTKKGDVGSHRREAVFIGHGSKFPKYKSKNIFDHSTFPSLLLDTAGVVNSNFNTDLVDYISSKKEEL